MPLKPKLDANVTQENTKSREADLKTNRGSDLRHKMEESAEYGAQYRAQHQGADLTKTEIKHEEKFENPDDRKIAQHSDLTKEEQI
jgi:hypothetical protein